MRQLNRTAISLATAHVALMWSVAAFAQTAPAPAGAASAAAKGDKEATSIVVTGQRTAIQSAQKIKREAEEIVDSIVADDIGKLPDRSVSEVLQRIVGVTMDRTMAKNDPEHYSVEGSSISIRGLSYVRSEFNGRDSFSANGGRALNFEDVPPELMAGVDVYKNPSAEQIEGSIGGLVNLRTALPFDFKETRFALAAQTTHSTLKGGQSPSYSGMFSKRWNTDMGDFGVLVHLATSESGTRTDAFQVEPYYPLASAEAGQAAGTYRWVPKGAQWRTLLFDRKRDGAYAALQWKKDSLDSSLTYFKSDYRMQWDERAIFAQSEPYKIRVSNGTWDSQGALLTGVLRNNDGSGINFGADTRTSNRKSSTEDLAWRLNWKASDRWSFSSDLQVIRAKTKSFDSTVATGVQMAKQTVDLGGEIPSLSFDAADRAALADPANYYWAFTMEHQDKSNANEKAWRGDAKFKFEDPVLQDLRFGLRFTDRDAVTTNTVPGYNWQAITQPWQVGWNISKLAYLNDPRFSANTSVYNFNNFFNGKASVPALIFPDISTATGYPGSYAALQKYHDILCQEQVAAQGWGSCDAWKPASFGTDPAGTNDQRERTQAAYTQLRFGFDDLKYPVDGNIGLRVVHTEAKARGYTVFTAKDVPVGATGVAVPVIPSFSKAEDYSNSYTNLLPSLNLRMKASDTLQVRFAFGQGISRPDFDKMQAYTTMSQDFNSTTNTNTGATVINSVSRTGRADGNPLLKPIRSTQADATAEWYFDKTGSLTFAAFHKELKDIIINQTYSRSLPDSTGKLQDFTLTGPINGAKGKATGFEVAFQTYFDALPGFGIQANYTFVDSKTTLYTPVNQALCSASSNDPTNLNLNLNGCDTDGRTFGNLPLANLSKHAYNLALLFERGPFSARVAYNWRSKYLQAVNVNGTQGTDGLNTATGATNVAWGLPVWQDGYGQLDAGLFYKVHEQFTVGLEGQNLTDSLSRQLMQQHIGFKTRAVFATGPRYTLTARYSF